MKPDSEASKKFLLRQKLVELQSADAAIEVRVELQAAIEENRHHTLDARTIEISKNAKPYGEYPSHRTLLLTYGLL